MELQDITGTFQQAQRLAALGVTQFSFHHWLQTDPQFKSPAYVDTGAPNGWMISRTACYAPAPTEWGETYSAFTVTELSRAISVLVTAPAFNDVIQKLSQEREADHDKKTIDSDVYVWQTMFDPVFLSDLLIRVLEAVPKRMIDEVNKALTK